MHIRCWDELVRYGALDVLGREYGPLLVAEAEPEYNVSLVIDLEQVPTDQGVFSDFQCCSMLTHISRGPRCLHHVSRIVQATRSCCAF